jgi:hypothetical protein
MRQIPTQEQMSIINELEPYGYKLENIICPYTCETSTVVREGFKYYTIEEAVDRYFELYALED